MRLNVARLDPIFDQAMGDRREIFRPAAQGVPAHSVLIIDYDPRTLQSLGDALSAAGYRVAIAKDGPAGVAAFHQHHPTVTLVECIIPRKSGLEVCAELRKLPGGADAPIILMSSKFRGRQYRSEAKHLNLANEFLDKPIDPAALVSLVDTLCGFDRAVALLGGPEEPAAEVIAPPPAGPKTAPADEAWEVELDGRLDLLLGK